MNNNEALITKFYTAFSNRDYKEMQECYTDNATFNDPVFRNLNALQVKAMWEMLCIKAKDLRIEFKNIKADDNKGKAEWTAYYSFSATGKKVINHIKSEFIFEDGKIIKHIDSFSFYNWSRQALGTIGLLLGWTSFLQIKVRRKAMKNLLYFMDHNYKRKY